MEKQLFVEGSDVKKGDLLYILERQPFQAAVDVQKAAIAQAEAQLENANISLWHAQQRRHGAGDSVRAASSAPASRKARRCTSTGA